MTLFVAVVALTTMWAGAAEDPSRRFVARWGGHTKDLAFGVAAHAANVFVTGATFSADFPVSAGSPSADQTWCAFFTRLNASSGALVQSSVLCGRGMTYGLAVTEGDRDGDNGSATAWIAGNSDGPGLPVSRHAAQEKFGGGSATGTGDGFVAHWNTRGNVDYLTYVGGAGDETVWGIASDRAGGIWAAGSTTSKPFFPVTSGETTGTIASADGFLVHFESDGRLKAVKIIGGSGVDELYDVVLLDSHSLVVVGATASTDAVLGKPHGGMDGFVALMDPTTLTVSWTLRIGGKQNDSLKAVAVVDERTIVAAGRTDGGACRAALGGTDGWLVTISKRGSVLRNECVGTSSTDYLSDVAVTPDGAVWVTGTTDTASRTASAYDKAFTYRIGSTGPLTVVSNEIARGYAITADTAGNLYAVGETTAIPGRTGNWTPVVRPTSGAFRGDQRLGSTDAYVIALQP